jgi:hypothetical protein
MYSALYKYRFKKIINNLTIYNPLRGTMTDIMLEHWDKHDELLLFMDNIRTCRFAEK